VRAGPEAELEKMLVGQLGDFFPVTRTRRPLWTASYVPIGAGLPDLVIATWHPEVVALANVEFRSTEILAYLRAVRRASLPTIVERMRQSKRKTDRQLEELVAVKAVCEKAGLFSLRAAWRDILSEIITIEAKVENWRAAIGQAARNHIFAHRSYVALPERVAIRIRKEPAFLQFGLGLFAVSSDGNVEIIRRGRRHQPRVWLYYYRLAALLAADFEENRRSLESQCFMTFPYRKHAKSIRNLNS
jgi:hypothetical protein